MQSVKSISEIIVVDYNYIVYILCTQTIYCRVNNSNYCSLLCAAQHAPDEFLSTFDRMFAVTATSVIASSVFCRTTQTTDITSLNSVKLSDSVGTIMAVGAVILVLGVIIMRHHKSITLLS